jgi:hypothetical protein
MRMRRLLRAVLPAEEPHVLHEEVRILRPAVLPGEALRRLLFKQLRVQRRSLLERMAQRSAALLRSVRLPWQLDRS